MKKFAKIIALMLCFALVACCFAACGGKTEPANTDETTAADNAATDTDATTPAAEGEAFKIGLIGPLTGGAAIYGNAAKNGA